MKPPLLIPGKEGSIKSPLGVSSGSIAISRGEMQEGNLYRKACVWLYSSSPEITIYLLAKYYFTTLKKISVIGLLHPLGEQQLEFCCSLKMLKEGGEKPTR